MFEHLQKEYIGDNESLNNKCFFPSFVDGLHDAQLRWELKKSKVVMPEAAVALEIELNAFMEMDSSLRSRLQATLNMVSTAPPQHLIAITSSSLYDMMGTLIQTVHGDIQKVLPQASQNYSS